MGWFNYYGLGIMIIIMVPNIIYAIRHKDGFENKYKNKAVEISEQIGRYACFAFMIFNIPYTYRGFFFESAEIVYIAVNGGLLFAYCLTWIVSRNSNSMVRAVLLSVIPSAVFLFSGIMVLSIPLIVFALLFSVMHVLLSVNNAASQSKTEKRAK